MAVLSLVLFLTFLDNTIVSVALSDIQSSLHAGISALQWTLNGYVLAFCGLMLSFGTVGDQLGRRKVMAAGVAVFCAGSVLAAVASSSGMLIAGRVIMGVGAAASEPGTLSMIRQIFRDREERATALGAWAAVSGMGICMGPVIGGLLIGVWSWRGVFVFNVALGLVALAGTTVLPESSDPTPRGLDYLGFLLSAGALAAATVATIIGERTGYFTLVVDLLYGAALLLVVLFIFWERRVTHPVLDLRFFSRRDFTAANVIAFAGYFGAFGVFFFTPLYLLIVGNASGYQVALDFMFMALGAVLSSVATGYVVAAIGPMVPMATGCVLSGAMMLVLHFEIGPKSGFGLLSWTLFLIGAGLGLITVSVNATGLSAVPPERSGMAASTVNTFREFGALVGVSVLGAILNGKLTNGLEARLEARHVLKPFINLAVTAVETGQTGQASSLGHNPDPVIRNLVNEILPQAYAAFGDGLHAVLILAGGVLLASAVLAFTVPNRLRTKVPEGSVGDFAEKQVPRAEQNHQADRG